MLFIYLYIFTDILFVKFFNYEDSVPILSIYSIFCFAEDYGKQTLTPHCRYCRFKEESKKVNCFTNI